MTDDTQENFDWLEGGDAPAGKGQIVNKAQCLKFFGVNGATFDRWIKAGAPVISKGTKKQGYQLNSSALWEWHWRWKVANATGGDNAEVIGFETAKRRDKTAQAQLRELQVRQRSGELIEMEEARQTINAGFGELRNRVIALATQVPTLTPEQRDQLDAAINDALAGFSEKMKSNHVARNQEEASDA